MRDVTTRRKLLLGAAAGVAVAATAGAVRLAHPKGAGLPAVGQLDLAVTAVSGP
jgi:hypothetical protein